MKRLLLLAALTLTQIACGMQPEPQSAQPQNLTKTQVDQGSNWWQETQAAFYTTDQGSRLMPLKWFRALKQANGEPFLPDGEGLSRYGYLKNGVSKIGLPVGFTTNGPEGNAAVGMTCSACHTREIEVGGKAYRIDGGPAIADFQTFLHDIDVVAGKLVNKNGDAFKAFARAVLDHSPSVSELDELNRDFLAWYKPYHLIVSRSLPNPAWGPGRLDAISMIFNRLTGLDIGPASAGYMIPKNIHPAVAPTRYPFLWNAATQARTQWPGFANNGTVLRGLSRNTGEVIGVFADVQVKPDPSRLAKVDYTTNNSANIDGLMDLENLMQKIGPPKFPWPINEDLRKRGEEVFKWSIAQGSGCNECHGKVLIPGTKGVADTWQTPVQDVGTDSREYTVLLRKADSGVMAGTKLLSIKGTPLPREAFAKDILGQAVGGTILQRLGTFKAKLEDEDGSVFEEIVAAFTAKKGPKPEGIAYESRVLEGIWAVAPYLHNGSVPTLADLLEPVSKRPKFFKVGPNYDPIGKVGLAAEQTKFGNYTLKTGCPLTRDAPGHPVPNRSSGNSNCGHEYGVKLKPEDKKALLEYLKTL